MYVTKLSYTCRKRIKERKEKKKRNKKKQKKQKLDKMKEKKRQENKIYNLYSNLPSPAMAILDSGDDNKIGGPLFQTDEYVCLNI
jgi:hypothetical protein